MPSPTFELGKCVRMTCPVDDPIGLPAIWWGMPYRRGVSYFSLVIGELVPKQIALRNPESSPSEWRLP